MGRAGYASRARRERNLDRVGSRERVAGRREPTRGAAPLRGDEAAVKPLMSRMVSPASRDRHPRNIFGASWRARLQPA
jgi:hypothetical protein